MCLYHVKKRGLKNYILNLILWLPLEMERGRESLLVKENVSVSCNV